ncbi:MAG: DUF393 domain-containing protein [Sediminibacterium sp.]|nr:DUF393 domain-containing protein [Sediminibacterium sp.]
MSKLATYQHPIILFDGVCNLCSSSVQFVIKHDSEQKFKFASLQSDIAKSILQDFAAASTSFNSVILVEEGKVYYRSTAALRIAKQLSFPYNLLYAFIIVPPFIRNLVYDYIAKNRYQWFGKKEECWVPTEELRDRFM